MIIDVHGHYGEWFFWSEKIGAERIVELMAECDIEKTVLSSSLAVVYDFVEGNCDLDLAIKNYPQLLGYVVLNPNYPELSRKELATYLKREHFVGVKLHPSYTKQAINSPATMKILDFIEEYQVPVLIHTYGDMTYQVEEAARKHPGLQIIMGHMGGNNWQAGIEVAEKVDNTYLEICCSYVDSDRMEQAVRAIGSQRVLFGSDSTLIHPSYMLGMIKDAEINEEDKRKILYQNAKELFGI